MKPDSGIPVVDSAVGRRHVQPTPVRRRLRQVQSWAILTLLGAASVVFAACGDTTPTPSDDSLIWQYDTGTEGELVIVSPTVTGGVVYASSYEDSVYALDAESGELLWTFEADSDLSPPPPVVGGVVFVEDLDNLYALDAATGKELWRSEPLYFSVSGESAYQGTETADGLEVSAIDGWSGEKMWATNVSRSFFPLFFPLTAAGSNVYVSDDHRVHALDSTTGKLVWTLDAGDQVTAPPTASNGVVFLRTYTTAYALDESTGGEIWSHEVDSAESNFPLVVDGVWYLNDWSLRALDSATGQLVWSFAVDKEKADLGEATSQPLAVAEGMVFVNTVFTYESSRNAFHALDAVAGDEVWSIDDSGLTSIMVVDEVLYAHSLDGYLHTLDARTGEPIWSVDIGYHRRQRPFAVSEGVVYMGYLPTSWPGGAPRPLSGVRAYAAPSRR